MSERMTKMKAVKLYGVGDLRLEIVDKPEAGLGEVIAKIKAALTCGTDVKTFVRGHPKMEKRKEPRIFGHEWAGDVVEMGAGVTGLEEGMRIVASDQVSPCLKCYFCKKEQYNMCENPTVISGTYAEYIKIPEWAVKTGGILKIPDNLSYEEAALYEPLSCCIHGIERSNIRIGDTVAIIGSGPVGLCHLQLAKTCGAEKVIISDLVDFRLKVAEKLGADETINAKNEDPVKKVKELTGGYGADVVIEAVGTPNTWEQAISMARKGGLVNEFAGCAAGTEIRIKTERLHYDELTIIGSYWATHRDAKKALDLLASGRVQAKPIITHKMKLEDVNEAFKILTTTKEALKIALIP